jgi:membrane fusion protein, multidrug efflux system
MKKISFIIISFFIGFGTYISISAQETGDFLDGIIEPSEVVDIGSQTQGILDSIMVERGDFVHKGQILVTLKSGPERVDVDQARQRLEFSKRRTERNDELFKKQLISSKDRDEMETEVRLNELQLKNAEERLAMRTVVSPLNGVVVKRLVSPGEYIGVDPLLTIARIDTLHVDVIVPIERFGSINQGMTAEVRPESPVGGKYIARVTIVDKVIDAASGTFGVRLELPNLSFRLPAGLKCQVKFIRK